MDSDDSEIEDNMENSEVDIKLSENKVQELWPMNDEKDNTILIRAAPIDSSNKPPKKNVKGTEESPRYGNSDKETYQTNEHLNEPKHNDENENILDNGTAPIITNTNQGNVYLNYIKNVINRKMINYLSTFGSTCLLFFSTSFAFLFRNILYFIWKFCVYSFYSISIFVIVMLSTVLVIGEWEDANQIVHLQSIICDRNADGSFSKIELEPWNEGIDELGIEIPLEDMFISQVFYSERKEYSSLLQAITENHNEYSTRYLLVAEQGYGKTTALKKLINDWCSTLNEEDMSFRIFKYAIQNYVGGHVHDNMITNNLNANVISNIILPNLPRILYNVITKCICDDGNPFVNIISLYHAITKKDKMPILVFAFEFRDIININTLADAIFQKIIKDSTLFTSRDIDMILKREVRRVLLALDGWDEYSKLKYKVGAAPEMEAIVTREEKKNINLIVTTRQWKSEDLLSVRRYGFEKLSLDLFHLPEDRDTFINNFFSRRIDAHALIDMLNDNHRIIPEELQTQPRMLLYICNIWKHDRKIIDNHTKNMDKFWNHIWNMMMLTYNRKYPQTPMSIDKMNYIRQDVGIFNLENGNERSISIEKFNDRFGDELDLFYFGLYSHKNSPPWEGREQYVMPVNPSMIDAQKEVERNSINEAYHGVGEVHLIVLIIIFHILMND